MKMWHEKATPGTPTDPGARTVLEQGVESLVTLREPVMTKNGIAYRYLHGPVFVGRLSTWSRSKADLQIGNENTANHVITPMSNVVGIQECHKVLTNPEVLTLK